jgi:uncharacterized membrane protein YfcA
MFLGVLCGGSIGLVLGLVGGGGSILALPMMIYVVGVSNPHIAIGTSALSVSANSAMALVHHARSKTVNWSCGLIFAAGGMAGALIGAKVGKAVDGKQLLFLFAIIMIVVGVSMLRNRRQDGTADAKCDRRNTPSVVGIGTVTGAMSGFFGIGGGFLIVPGLMRATRMRAIDAVGTSLLAVTAFGLTTASSYGFSGLVDWSLAGAFVLGGSVGANFGTALSHRFSRSGLLLNVFAGLIFAVAFYMIFRSL